ncbi:MAG: hypothetical protein WBN22_06120 [Verrucomicrobiia bacterium]
MNKRSYPLPTLATLVLLVLFVPVAVSAERLDALNLTLQPL